MTGHTGIDPEARRPDDVESPVRRTGAFGGVLGFLSLSPPLPASRVAAGRRHGR
jgi:hypothetical protein